MGKAELKIEIDADLLAQARASGLDLAQTVADALRLALPPPGVSEASAHAPTAEPSVSSEEKARRWAEENAGAIQAQRERIDDIGVFGEDLRTW